jgi:DNA polymerase III subunit gamma/tau
MGSPNKELLFFIMSLYRKYRPQTFSHLVGQDHVNKTLLNALCLNRVSHAYLFTGPRGTGKTSTARLLAKAINCLSPNANEPCNTCDICTEIGEGRLIDLIEIDAASNRGIDEMRDLREKINFAPTRAKSKVYIIDEVHMLTKEAFNALLKTLEEPPSHVYFILATTEAHKIPETILSRCQRFDFHRIEDKTLVERLKFIAKEENIEADEKALELIAHHAEGGLRDAIGLLEQLTHGNKLSYDYVCTTLGVSGIGSFEKLYDLILSNDAKSGLEMVNELFENGFDLIYFNKRFLEYLRKKLMNSVAEGAKNTKEILEYVNFFQDAYYQAKFAVVPQLPLEMAIVKSSMLNGTMQNSSKSVAVKPEEPRVVEKVQEKKDEQPSVPREQITEIQNAPIQDQQVSFDEVKDKWVKFLNHIKSPVVKRSLQQTKPINLTGANLTLAFSNHFHKEKLLQTDNRVEMEKAFHDFFGASFKIDGQVKIEENPPVKKTENVKTNQPAPKPLEETVMDIFEGEMV